MNATVACGEQVTAVLPAQAIAILPLREEAIFPGVTKFVRVGRPRSIRMLDWVIANDPTLMACAIQRSSRTEDPTFDELLSVATACRLHRVLPCEPGVRSVLLEGVQRFAFREPQREPFHSAAATWIDHDSGDVPEEKIGRLVDLACNHLGTSEYAREIRGRLNDDVPAAPLAFQVIHALERLDVAEVEAMLEAPTAEHVVDAAIRIMDERSTLPPPPA